jgi:hypothetical protein
MKDSNPDSKDNSKFETENSSNNNSENNSKNNPEDFETKERKDHNAPESIVDDLDLIDKARAGDKSALNEIKEQYPEFFNDNNDEQGLEEVEEYLEEEFPLELEQSE